MFRHNWLFEVVIHARPQTFFAVFGHGMGGNANYDGMALAPFPLPNLLSSGITASRTSGERRISTRVTPSGGSGRSSSATSVGVAWS
jgi:hypothetical protein